MILPHATGVRKFGDQSYGPAVLLGGRVQAKVAAKMASNGRAVISIVGDWSRICHHQAPCCCLRKAANSLARDRPLLIIIIMKGAALLTPNRLMLRCLEFTSSGEFIAIWCQFCPHSLCSTMTLPSRDRQIWQMESNGR